MDSDTDLPHQLDSYHQQTPLMNKKSSLIWIATVIFLLIANLQYLDFLYSWYTDYPFFAFRNSFLGSTPHLSTILAVDLVAASFYLQKKSNPNWKVIFILLFMCNLIFYGHMLYWIITPLARSYLSLALLGAFPYFSILSAVDFIAVFIKKHPHDGRVYIALLVVSLVLFFTGVFVFQFSAFGLIPRR